MIKSMVDQNISSSISHGNEKLLIDGRKFDIRVWVLFSHDFKVYFFKEGYVRTSSSLYSVDENTFQDVNVHLTNNAIQKYGENYGKYE